jgi:hypothetical protein
MVDVVGVVVMVGWGRSRIEARSGSREAEWWRVYIRIRECSGSNCLTRPQRTVALGHSGPLVEQGLEQVRPGTGIVYGYVNGFYCKRKWNGKSCRQWSNFQEPSLLRLLIQLYTSPEKSLSVGLSCHLVSVVISLLRFSASLPVTEH